MNDVGKAPSWLDDTWGGSFSTFEQLEKNSQLSWLDEFCGACTPASPEEADIPLMVDS